MTGDVAVLGGTGFVGRAVVRCLAAAGCRVTVLARSGDAPGAARVLHGEAGDARLLRRAVRGKGAVVNLLGQITTPLTGCADANGPIAAALGEALGEQARLVHVSSVAVYGRARVADESAEPEPTTPYGALKLAAERILGARVRRLTVLRVANAFGPGQRQGVLAYLGRARDGDRRLTFAHDGSMRRDLIHVDDVAEAVALAIGAPQPVHPVVYNVASGSQVTVRALVARCERRWGIRFRPHWGAAPVVDNIGRIPIARVRRALGFRALSRLDDFLMEAV